MLEFCDETLGSFNEEQISELLEEHKRTGTVKNSKYNVQLQIALTFTKESVIESVIKKAELMKADWIVEIIKAVKKEGIELPEPNKN